jgi:ADP-heptose:LPS heptosyltransferase
MFQRILVIRGGAIGDFILTLPALKALRNTYPDAHIEILGYKHIAVLAENRFYAQAFDQSNTDLSPASSQRIHRSQQNWQTISRVLI